MQKKVKKYLRIQDLRVTKLTLCRGFPTLWCKLCRILQGLWDAEEWALCSFETQEKLTQWHCDTTQKTWIFSNAAVENLNVANNYSTNEDVSFKENEDYMHLIYMKW